MRKRLAILLFLFFHFSYVLPMEKPSASGSACNFARIKKVVSSPMPPRQKDTNEGLRPRRSYSESPFVFPTEDEKDKDLLVAKDLNDLGLSEEVKERDKILTFHRSYHNWEYLLPEQQKILVCMLPAHYEYRSLYGSYFYGNKKDLKSEYESACVKIQKLIDDFDKHQLPMKLEKIRSFSLASYCLSSFIVINGRYPICLFDRNLFVNHYKHKRDLYLKDPFNDKAFLEVVALQEEVSDLAKQEKLRNE
jgi:hypothetical protein